MSHFDAEIRIMPDQRLAHSGAAHWNALQTGNAASINPAFAECLQEVEPDRGDRGCHGDPGFLDQDGETFRVCVAGWEGRAGRAEKGYCPFFEYML